MNGVCDTSLAATWRDAPNCQPRRKGLTPTILLMHYTGMESSKAALDQLCSATSNVSCHYLIDEDGEITQMVKEDERAWHAGLSQWAGEDDINSCSIGIEIVNKGHDEALGIEYEDFPEQQIVAVMELSKDIIKRHSIQPRNVIGHSDVAPQRKKDPGEKFPWARLYQNGIGHWVPPVNIGDDKGFEPGGKGEKIAIAQRYLAQYGYQIEANGRYDEQMFFVIEAFQRHFRPQKVDGRLDHSTMQTLRNLIEALPQGATS